MASETTAAATGAVGVVRRDPMAMRPFVGYNMGDYFNHWIEMGDKIANKPKIFNVNWFRTDDNGNFIWPGFGDNLRVLDWILDRCENKVGADETAIGYVPKAEDINIEGLEDVSIDTIKELLNIDNASWTTEAEGIEAFYAELGARVPKALYDELAKLKANLAK
jgi:phosphoenolpyruvate carboxykinase (GTP)